jgi:hypothetical protein
MTVYLNILSQGDVQTKVMSGTHGLQTHLMNWKALLRSRPLNSKTACSKEGVNSMRVMRFSVRNVTSCGGSYITSSGMIYIGTPVT